MKLTTSCLIELHESAYQEDIHSYCIHTLEKPWLIFFCVFLIDNVLANSVNAFCPWQPVYSFLLPTLLPLSRDLRQKHNSWENLPNEQRKGVNKSRWVTTQQFAWCLKIGRKYIQTLNVREMKWAIVLIWVSLYFNKLMLSKEMQSIGLYRQWIRY